MIFLNKFQKHLKCLIKNKQSSFLLALIILFALVIRLYFFVGLTWCDNYTHHAHRLLTNGLNLGTSLSNLRIMGIYPLALFFLLFGVNNLSAGLYSLITSLGSIILIFYLGKFFFNEKIGLLSAFFLSIFPLNIIYGTSPFNDVPIGFFSALSIFLILKADKNEIKNPKKKYKNRILFLLSGILIGINYLHKVSGVITFVFALPYILYKTIKKREVKLDYSLIFLGFLTIILLEGALYANLHGNFFTRYDTVSKFYREDHDINRDLKFYPTIMFNLNYGNFSFNYKNYFNEFGIFYYFIAISLIYILTKKDKNALIVLSWFILILLYLEFGTMSLTNYNIIHKVNRHLTLITIPGILCLSYFLVNFINGKNYRKIRKIIFMLAVFLILASSVFYTYYSYWNIKTYSWDVEQIYNYTKN
ncbi:MAG TPA: phospholipid carrier-dependent glycosyltransferase, partial [Candidatus Atribacteria bacterium]|nr:phospholipid carrier-dependent glycosyltransferase [Candidatus Atribacteria bacterium]